MNTSSKFTGIVAIAALFGIVALIVSLVILNFGGIAAFSIGVIVAIITWVVLWLGWGEDGVDQSTSGSDEATGINKPTTGAAPAAPAVVATAAFDAPAGAKAGSTAAKGSKPAAKQVSGNAKTAKPDATKATAVKSPASQAAPDGKPVTLTAARASGADDLKLLKGVGPALEKTLNGLGFYHFDQVAAWREAEIEWVDSRLKFKGRIVRDDWIKQAETLAEGGETEFSKRAKK